MFLANLVLQIANKCLSAVLKLQHLEDLALEGCLAIDDDSLAEMLNLLVSCFDVFLCFKGKNIYVEYSC